MNYYLIAAIVYGIFIVQFILSWFGGDFNIDADIDFGDIVSFKGLIHFLMGATGWLCLRDFSGSILWYDYIIAVICGLSFMIMLFYLYKLLMKLEQKPDEPKRGKALIGKGAYVYLLNSSDNDAYYYTIIAYDGTDIAELPARSTHRYQDNTAVVIKNFIGNYYII